MGSKANLIRESCNSNMQLHVDWCACEVRHYKVSAMQIDTQRNSDKMLATVAKNIFFAAPRDSPESQTDRSQPISRL